jgi:hypothetical protein
MGRLGEVQLCVLFRGKEVEQAKQRLSKQVSSSR